MKNIQFIILIIILIYFTNNIFAQKFPTDVYFYPFIKYNENKFEFYGDSSKFENLYSKFDELILKGNKQITVLQIGASHTQADIFSGHLRKRFQTFMPGINAGRGFVFPFKMTKTNNPSNYTTHHSGKWEVSRIVDKHHTTLGITGIAAETFDSTAFVSVEPKHKKYLNQPFYIIKVFHSTDKASYKFKLEEDVEYEIISNDSLQYSIIKTKEYLRNFTIKLTKTDNTQNHFILYGFSLETQDPGFIYHAMGINGSSTHSYLGRPLFKSQLKIINPDWVIIDLGTNDGYTLNFDSTTYYRNYSNLIKNIKKVVPNVAITLITPNDCYYKRRRPNPATAKQVSVIRKLSEKYGCCVWDKYNIMGGYNSSVLWQKKYLMASDKIHFSVPGYTLLGDLFFVAFLNSWDNHLNTKNSK